MDGCRTVMVVGDADDFPQSLARIGAHQTAAEWALHIPRAWRLGACPPSRGQQQPCLYAAAVDQLLRRHRCLGALVISVMINLLACSTTLVQNCISVRWRQFRYESGSSCQARVMVPEPGACAEACTLHEG